MRLTKPSFVFCVSTWQMLILDPGHRSTHACTDTLGVNTISSERTGKQKTQTHYKNKDIYGVKERGCIFSDCRYFLHVICTIWTVLQQGNKRLSFLKNLSILKQKPESCFFFNNLSLMISPYCVSSFQIHWYWQLIYDI